MTVPLALCLLALIALLLATAIALAGLLGGLALAPAAGPSIVERPLGWAPHRLVQLAAALLLASLAALSVVAGRAPWASLPETARAFGAAVLLAYLFVSRDGEARSLAGPVAALAAALTGLGLAIPDELMPLQPALQQPLLLTVHVGTAIASYGVGGIAFVAALVEIIQRRTRDGIRGLPGAAAARRATQRAVLIAFPLLTAAVVLGSVWANLAWRSYWNNDPKELAAAATWLVYAAQLHLAGRRDRWGAAAPWLLVLGFAGILFTWLGAGLVFVGQHSYATR